MGFVILILMFYAINWLTSECSVKGWGRKILLFSGLFFLFAYFSQMDWLIPAILIFLLFKKFKKKKSPKKEPLSAEEIEKLKKDYEVMLNNHLITQENYEKMVKQLDNHS